MVSVSRRLGTSALPRRWRVGTRLRSEGYAGASTRPPLFTLITEQYRITAYR